MPHPIQRSACDRCHGQKLRCMRTTSGGACVRCTKARAICTWGPSLRCRRGLSPSDTVDERHSHAFTPLPTNALCLFTHPDSSFILGDGVFPDDSTLWPAPLIHDSASGSSSTLIMSANSPLSPTSQLQPQNTSNTWQDRFNREWAILSSEEEPLMEDDISEEQSALPKDQEQERSVLPIAVIRELSNLNVDLFSLSSSVPEPPTSTSQPLSWKDKDFAIDKTFQLSQRFIEALDKLYPRSAATQSVSSPSQRTGSDQPTPFDQASFLLMLSCYQRLMETYDDIFGNVQACLDRSAVTAPEDYVAMPNVKVGTFSLPNSSALQITLVLQLARHLLQRMGSIIKALDQSRTLAGNGTSDLLSPTFTAVSTRETDLIERINKLRNTLVSLDIL
ncbi:hypothetical protein F4804DRAFT_345447 [Jackrogersella minutella]|nr:hypothetical protein F4804DRAFT_345447 [Jackrogersella minutella]